MSSDYYNLPFGGQLLVWTSRMYINGYNRTIPNKHEMIKMAYNKVNIFNGYDLLNNLLSLLRNNEKFNLQKINSRRLNENEILLTECVEHYKHTDKTASIFIKKWELKKIKDQFSLSSHNLAKAYLNANLHTSNKTKSYKNNLINLYNMNLSNTVH